MVRILRPAGYKVAARLIRARKWVYRVAMRA
jgi:hypothetical protein